MAAIEKEGVAIPQEHTSKKIDFWEQGIIGLLGTSSMSADDLIGHLLSECYENIDHEANMIIVALNNLILFGKVRALVVLNKPLKTQTLYEIVRVIW